MLKNATRQVILASLSLLALSSTSTEAFAEPLDPKFFANASFQNQFPGAFALQEESLAFVERSFFETLSDGDRLIDAIRNHSRLLQDVLDFSTLSPEQKRQTLQDVFQLEVSTSGFQAPELVLDDQAARSAFFDFDPKHPGNGRVILNPAKLFSSSNPYEALALLIHETRHSYQFQLAFKSQDAAKRIETQRAFQPGFVTQKQIFEQSLRVSFCDFLTLNHEYEAFLYGNYVLETLTN